MVNVTAVVLTYNRRELVQQCLRALLAQSRRIDRILVVDNCSTDDTPEVLAGFVPEGVEVRSLPRNVGAAGGFHESMRLGYETGADFVWVMDDDVIAASDALEELLRAMERLDAEGVEAPFVVSAARSPRGLMTNVPEVDLRANALAYENWPHLLQHGLVPVTRATFVSALFRRGTLERFGLPIPDMFIWGEDSEYTRRVTRDVPGYMVGRSQVEHVRAVAGALDIRTETDPVRIGWHRIRIRNHIYTERRYHGRREAMRHAGRLARVALSLLRAGESRKAWVMLQGVLLGWTFDPDVPPVRLASAPSPLPIPLALQPGSPQQA